MPNTFAAALAETPSTDDGSAARRRRNQLLAQALMKQGSDTSMPFTSGAVGGLKLANGLMGGVLSGLEDRKLADAEAAGAAALSGLPGMLAARGAPAATGNFGAPSMGTPSAPAGSGGKTAMSMPNDPAIETRFLGTLKDGGLTNQFGLAAAGAYANAESGYSAKNITGSWSDPSQSGQPGTSGGILSWRGPRLEAMRNFTAGASDPVTAQAQFFLKENPTLTTALQNAKSPEEAHSLMANAWRFAGFNQPGGEAQRRLDMTRSYVGRVGGGQQAQANPADLPGPNAAPAGFDPMGNYTPNVETTPDGFAIPPGPQSVPQAANLGLPAPDAPGPLIGLAGAVGGDGEPDLSGTSWSDGPPMPAAVMSGPVPDPLGAPGTTSMAMYPREGGGWVPAPPPRDGSLPTMPMPTAAETGPVSPPQPPSSATKGPPLPSPGPTFPRSETGLTTAMDAPPPLPPARPDFASMPAPGAQQTALADPARQALISQLMAPRQPDMTTAENAGVNDFNRAEANPAMRSALARQLMGGQDAPPVEPRQRLMAEALAPGLATANDAGPQTMASPGASYGGPTGQPMQISPQAQQQAMAPPPQSGGVQGFFDRIFGGGAPAQPAAASGPMAQIQALANSPNPVHQLAARQMVQQLFQRPEFGFQMTPDGNLVRTDKHGGTAVPVYNSPRPSTFGVVGENGYGDKQYGFVNPNTQSVAPYQAPNGAPGGEVLPGQPGSQIPAPPPGVDPKKWREVHSQAITSNAAPLSRSEAVETESKLRAEFGKNLGSFSDVHDGYGRVIAATQQRQANPNGISPASDIGLVFGYMKMLDPGSVVREGEYATAQNAAGVPDRVRNAYNKAMSGEFLGPEQRQDFIDTSARLYGQARTRSEATAERYRGLAGQYGVDAGRSVYLPDALTPPTVGDRRDGVPKPSAPVAAPPPQAVDHLRQNPALREAFDTKYGQGAAARALGGR